jgi:hypothetical protein
MKPEKPEYKEGPVSLRRGKSSSTRVKLPIKLNITIHGLDLAFCFCNLLARVYKVRPLCFQGSAFGHESAGSVLAQ